MNTHLVRRLLPAQRARGLALAGSALALTSMFCLQLGTSNRSAWQAVLQPGPASPDQGLAAVSGSLALALSLWLLGALLISLLSALASESSALGAVLARGARLIAPRALRNAVAALLGVAIAATPAIADAATISSGRATEAINRTSSTGSVLASNGSLRPTSTNPSGSRPDQALSPAWAVDTSRVSESAAHPGPSVPLPDLLPGWTPHRPSRASATSGSGSVHPTRPATPTSTGTPASTGAPASAAAGPPANRSAEISPRATSPAASGPAATRPATSAPTETRSRASGATGHSTKPTTPMVNAPRRAVVDPEEEIVVRRGDTLWSLAERHLGPGATDAEIAVEWPHWFTANRDVIGNDPDHLVPGERLRPPETGAPMRARTNSWSRGGQ